MPKSTRNIPVELTERQERQRQETIDSVQRAINELNSEGAVITTAKLIDRTGLSRSTLSKPHVQQILKTNQVGKFRKRKILSPDTPYEDRIAQLEKELFTVKNHYVEEQKRRIKLQEEKKSLDNKYQILVGKYHRVVVFARNYGVPLDFDEDS